MRDNRGVFRGDVVVALDVVHEVLDVGDAGADARRVAACAGAVAVTARVPGEEGEVVKAEFVGEIHQAAGMFVAAVEEDDGFVRAVVFRRAVAVKQLGAVAGGEGQLLLVHGSSLYEACGGLL